MKLLKSHIVFISFLIVISTFACICSALPNDSISLNGEIFTIYECDSLEEFGEYITEISSKDDYELVYTDYLLTAQVHNNYLLKDDCIFVPDFDSEITKISINHLSCANVEFEYGGNEFSLIYYPLDENGSSIIAASSKTVGEMKLHYTLYDGKLRSFYWMEDGKCLSLCLPQTISESEIDDYLHLCKVKKVEFSYLRSQYTTDEDIGIVEPLENCNLFSE